MLKPTTLYEEAARRHAEILGIITEKEEAIQKAPPGKIHIVKTRNRMQYYLREEASDKSGTYISKKKQATIQRYLQKSYDEKILQMLRKENKIIEDFIKHSENIEKQIKDIYSSNPDEIKSLIKPIDSTDEDYIKAWKDVPYEGNPIPIKTTEYKTTQGEIVRSKSELIIANTLSRYGIPYKYECPVILNWGVVLYPDFTMLDVQNRREIYWEHRGMMDDSEYSGRAVKKLKEYANSGIIIGDNLIITEETLENVLGTGEIEKIIKRLFF